MMGCSVADEPVSVRRFYEAVRAYNAPLAASLVSEEAPALYRDVDYWESRFAYLREEEIRLGDAKMVGVYDLDDGRRYVFCVVEVATGEGKGVLWEVFVLDRNGKISSLH